MFCSKSRKCCWLLSSGSLVCSLALLIASLHNTAWGQNNVRARQALNAELREILDDEDVFVPDSGLPAVPNAALIKLGQALFYDHELSGNRDISCATCHHPLLETGDRLSLPIGTGAMVKGELGPFRERGHDRNFIPRNAPEIFNRGSNLWFTQYWDSRISEDGNGGFVNPAGSDLPFGMPTC